MFIIILVIRNTECNYFGVLRQEKLLSNYFGVLKQETLFFNYFGVLKQKKLLSNYFGVLKQEKLPSKCNYFGAINRKNDSPNEILLALSSSKNFPSNVIISLSVYEGRKN